MKNFDLNEQTRRQVWGDHDLFVIAAFRYCINRIVYMVPECVQWLCQNWQHLQPETRKIIKAEVQETLDADIEGSWSDVYADKWREVLTWKD